MERSSAERNRWIPDIVLAVAAVAAMLGSVWLLALVAVAAFYGRAIVLHHVLPRTYWPSLALPGALLAAALYTDSVEVSTAVLVGEVLLAVRSRSSNTVGRWIAAAVAAVVTVAVSDPVSAVQHFVWTLAAGAVLLWVIERWREGRTDRAK